MNFIYDTCLNHFGYTISLSRLLLKQHGFVPSNFRMGPLVQLVNSLKSRMESPDYEMVNLIIDCLVVPVLSASIHLCLVSGVFVMLSNPPTGSPGWAHLWLLWASPSCQQWRGDPAAAACRGALSQGLAQAYFRHHVQVLYHKLSHTDVQAVDLKETQSGRPFFTNPITKKIAKIAYHVVCCEVTGISTVSIG